MNSYEIYVFFFVLNDFPFQSIKHESNLTKQMVLSQSHLLFDHFFEMLVEKKAIELSFIVIALNKTFSFFSSSNFQQCFYSLQYMILRLNRPFSLSDWLTDRQTDKMSNLNIHILTNSTLIFHKFCIERNENRSICMHKFACVGFQKLACRSFKELPCKDMQMYTCKWIDSIEFNAKFMEYNPTICWNLILKFDIQSVSLSVCLSVW